MSINRLMYLQIAFAVAAFLSLLSPLVFADADVSGRGSPDQDSIYDYDKCAETASWAIDVIPRFHSEGKFDMLNQALDLWTDDCGESEPIVRARILSAIEAGTFDESMYDSTIIDYLSMFRVSRESRYRNQSRFMGALFGDDIGVASAISFDSTLVAIAEKLAFNTDSNTFAHLLCRYYNGDFDYFFRRLKSGEFDQTKLHKYYTNHVDELRSTNDRFSFQYSLRAGRWYPSESMDVLDFHPEFGLSLGVMRKKFEIGLTGTVRWGDPNDKYQVYHKGRVRDADDYFGGYVGIDFGYEASMNRIACLVFFGIGYDGLVAIEGDDEEAGKALGSLNIGAGAHFRYFIDRYDSKYVGMLVRVSHVDYGNDMGTKLSGSTISIALTFGFRGSNERNRKLKLLDHD
jgi:hypothetical protein